MPKTEQQIALVTGASRGIGRAIAIKLAANGYAVALTARSRDGLEETARAIKKSGGSSALIVPADLRNPSRVEEMAEQVLTEWGKIDVLINNAGVMYNKPFLEIRLAELEEMLEVNFTSVFLLTQKVLPAMLDRREGTIVNIASLAGKHGFKHGSGYAATKFALRGFAQSLMLEVRDKGIRVITVFPGSVNTALSGRHPTSPRAESILQPEDVAHAVYAAISVDNRAMMSEIDLRPSNPQKS